MGKDHQQAPRPPAFDRINAAGSSTTSWRSTDTARLKKPCPSARNTEDATTENPCDQKAEADGTKCRDTDCHHIVRGTENSQKTSRKQLEYSETSKHNTYSVNNTQLNCFRNTFRFSGTIVEATMGTIPLFSANTGINTKLCSLKYTPNTAVAVEVKPIGDLIHSECHNRTNRRHNNRWKAYAVNAADHITGNLIFHKRNMKLFIQLHIHDHTCNCCNDLSPVTVARAAPVTSILGKPNKPKKS